MASEATTTNPSHLMRSSEPELEIVPLARVTRKTVERLAPFCQMRLPPESSSNRPLVPKTNSKILSLIHAIDTSMLIAQIGYRLASDAAALCDPFTPQPIHTVYEGNKPGAMVTPEMLQTMAAHGHGHCVRTNETFRNVQQDIFKIAAVTKDQDELMVLVPPDPQQPATRSMSLKEVGSDLVANLSLLNQFSRSMMDLTSWWEWLEEELMSPTNSTLLPVIDQKDAELCARWTKIKTGYLDYYNTIRVVYTRYPQLLTTSSAAWQSLTSVPPPPSAPGSSWDGSYQDIGAIIDEAIAETAQNEPSKEVLNPATATTPLNPEATEEEKKAKSMKSVKSVKAFVVKIGLGKVFGRKAKGETSKNQEEKRDKKGKGKATEEKPMDKVPSVDAPPDVEQELVRTTVEPPPATKEVPPQSQPQTDDAVVADDRDRRRIHSSRPSSSSSSSVIPKKEAGKAEAKKPMAKALAALKKVVAKLGCQGGSGIED